MQTPSTKPAQESGVWKVLPSSSAQIRYGSVSWSFHTPHYTVKPPHYHGSLFRTSRPRRRYMLVWNAEPFGSYQHPSTIPHHPAQEWSHSDLLNPQFVAVKVAEEVLQSSDADVGFSHSIMPDVAVDESCSTRVKFSVDVDEDLVQLGKFQWAVLARDLIGEIHLSRAISTPDLDVTRSQSPFSLEYDSEPSTDSDIPRTPIQTGTFSNVELNHPSPVSNTRNLSPSRTLNKSARAFTPKSGLSSRYSHPLASPSSKLKPGSRPSLSPSPVTFTFPAINGNYQHLPQGLKKDDQGFYSSVTPPSSPPRANHETRLSSARLPHFLSDAHSRSRKVSKTRVIIDQMKTTPVTGKKRRSRNHSELPPGEGNRPSLTESSALPNDREGVKKSELMKGESQDDDPDAASICSPLTTADTPATAANSRWKESSLSTPNSKAPFPSSNIATGHPLVTATPLFPPAPFVVQPLTPSFYAIPATPRYPYTYVLGMPTTTSWVPIPPPALPSDAYARPVTAHAAW